ncbi:DUF1653 domain-containing protein [Limnoglobus roseus]|uniref:DUF1653 domain-containing protein n=1 Tax=Limnoglobus roseus TaxID=2598579 RepID=A0A5C1AE69_9BACT|nr:DUF1653 domain-containing protein [Limnoglobus roseus]QEL17679.1 hypothetical protein PX52LOC_04677 [Limnoglobus roseus]
MTDEVKAGRYRHFKGQEYEVVDVACHHETKEAFVVYRALYGERLTWVRPVADFVARVDVPGGGSVARFLYIGTTCDEFPAEDSGDAREGDASA